MTLPAPLKDLRSMDSGWVSGELRVKRSDSALGASGYRLEAARVQRYEAR